MADEKKVFVESSVKEKLLKYSKSGDTSDVVYLCGSIVNESYHIKSCVKCTTVTLATNGGTPFEYDCLPKGIGILGVCGFTTKLQELDLRTAQGLLQDLMSKKSNHKRLLVWQHCLSTSEDNGVIYNSNVPGLAKCELQFGSFVQTFSQQIITFRVQYCLEICVENSFKALGHRIQKACQDLQSPSTTFLIEDCNMFLSCDDGTLITDEQDHQTCADLMSIMADTKEEEKNRPHDGRKNKSKKPSPKRADKTVLVHNKDAINVKLLTKISMSPDAYKDNSLVPVICYGEEYGTDISLSLPVDVVVMATRDTLTTELPGVFAVAVADQLKQMTNAVQGFSEGNNWCTPRPYHFKPSGFCHLVTILYPEFNEHGEIMDEKSLESYRTEIHKQLFLPLNRPLLRICNHYIFEKDRKPEPYLVNPHDWLSGSRVTDGTLGVVDGNYSYHHYMQDNFNDDKWGCAYRSLQTICSWFRHQGYTTKPAPSHRQIQQALVDVGDKKANFVGSRQWIGSFEVSLCLEHLLGVTSKILFVSSGAEMASKGRELLHHFQTQGTPIMIGGGVLAHTIIGVDYSQQTGDIKFLILDPHYTGSEDLKTILDKGWCGWKGPNFWDQQAHYNMCMPQRPNVI